MYGSFWEIYWRLQLFVPFVGSLSDLLGRRWAALMGAGLLVLCMIVCSTAYHKFIFIGTRKFLFSSKWDSVR